MTRDQELCSTSDQLRIRSIEIQAFLDELSSRADKVKNVVAKEQRQMSRAQARRMRNGYGTAHYRERYT